MYSNPTQNDPTEPTTTDTPTPPSSSLARFIRLPDMTPRERQVFAAIIDSHGDISSLFKDPALPPIGELLSLITSPVIQTSLAIVLEASEVSFHVHAAAARHTAIKALQNVADNAPDPIERRRAATAILRAAKQDAARDKRRQQQLRAEQESPAPLSPAAHPAPTDRAETLPSPSAPSAHPPGQATSSPPPPLTAHALLKLAGAALARPDDPEPSAGFVALRPLLDTGATFDGAPIPTDPHAPLTSAQAQTILNLRRFATCTISYVSAASRNLLPPAAADTPIPPNRKHLAITDSAVLSYIFAFNHPDRSAPTPPPTSKPPDGPPQPSPTYHHMRFHLKARPDSHTPNCFLITAIETDHIETV